MTAPPIRFLTDQQALTSADELVRTYTEVFSAPPWNEGPDDAADFRRRFALDVRRPGFRLAEAGDDEHLDGFATAWPTVLPLPDIRAYTRITEYRGPQRVHEFLPDALEVDELAVSPHARRSGLGRRLLDRVTAEAERSWLVAAVEATGAVAFYRRCGWTQVPSAADHGPVIFESPERPPR